MGDFLRDWFVISVSSIYAGCMRLGKSRDLTIGKWVRPRKFKQWPSVFFFSGWHLIKKFVSILTWDQAQFSFRFVKNMPPGKAKRKESLIQTFYETSAAHFFLIDWHLLNQPIKITSVACFFSMQIFHTWEKCRLADLKNSFSLLIFSTKNKTVSTITFNFLRD